MQRGRLGTGLAHDQLTRVPRIRGAALPRSVERHGVEPILNATAIMHMQRAAGNAATTLWLASASVQRTPASELIKKYTITIETGDKEWSASDVNDLKAALGKLDKEEAKKLAGYRFIRWSTRSERMKLDPTFKDWGQQECGLHELNLATPEVGKISMYDECWADPEARSGTDTMAGMPIGQAHLLHEIGHAMAFAEFRKAYVDEVKANLAYNAAVDEFNAASLKEQGKLQAKLDKLEVVLESAKERLEASRGRAQAELTELVAGKDDLTEYSKTSPDEALADAFVIYKGDPTGLKKLNPALYNWFANHGEWIAGKGKKKAAKKSK
jgi:hypothetical protein